MAANGKKKTKSKSSNPEESEESYYALAENSEEVDDQINYSPFRKSKSPLALKNTRLRRQLNKQKTALTNEEKLADEVGVTDDVLTENSNDSSSDSSSSVDSISDDDTESSEDTDRDDDDASKKAVSPPLTKNPAGIINHDLPPGCSASTGAPRVDECGVEEDRLRGRSAD